MGPQQNAGASGKGKAQWTVRRVGDNKIELTLPDNMEFTDPPQESININDVLSAIANSRQPRTDDRGIRCCGGGTAIV